MLTPTPAESPHATGPNANGLHTAAAIERLARRQLRLHWQRFVAEGIVMALIGVAAAVLPNVATLAIAILIGWLLFAAGLYGTGAALSARHAPGFWASLMLSLLTLVLGALLALQPIAAMLTLTMALIVYFVAHGAGMLSLAYSMREETRTWPWLVLSALVDFVLAGIVLSGWPGTAGWVIGLLVGINLMFSGIGLAVAAIGAHSADTGSVRPTLH